LSTTSCRPLRVLPLLAIDALCIDDGRLAAASADSGAVCVTSLTATAPIARCRSAHAAPLHMLAMSRAAGIVASADAATLLVHDARDGELLVELAIEDGPPTELAVAKDSGAVLLVGERLAAVYSSRGHEMYRAHLPERASDQCARACPGPALPPTWPSHRASSRSCGKTGPAGAAASLWRGACRRLPRHSARAPTIRPCAPTRGMVACNYAKHCKALRAVEQQRAHTSVAASLTLLD
jgi:hypothetical protein